MACWGRAAPKGPGIKIWRKNGTRHGENKQTAKAGGALFEETLCAPRSGWGKGEGRG